MVDKALFIGTDGAKNSMHQLQMITNNLANVNTVGFRADYETRKNMVVNAGNGARVYSVADKNYSDFQQGPLITTGRELDIAMNGKAFLAVQGKSGEEGYTRAGDLEVRDNLLKTKAGELVLGTNGVVNLPANTERVTIGIDGTVSAKVMGQQDPVVLSRVKLVTPDLDQLHKGTDGLFYLQNDGKAKPDFNATLTAGVLEGSNVNAVETLTHLIQLSRDFEFHTNLMKSIQENNSHANGLLQLPK